LGWGRRKGAVGLGGKKGTGEGLGVGLGRFGVVLVEREEWTKIGWTARKSWGGRKSSVIGGRWPRNYRSGGGK